MALYTRFVSAVDAATGSDVTASGSSATVKDSNASSTLVITNVAGGSTVVRGDAAAFAGPPVAGVDTLQFNDNSAGSENIYHIAAVSGDNKTLTLIEAPASAAADAADVWAVGGYFASIARAALLVTPTNTNSGADDHVYVKAGSGYSGTAKITFSKAGSRSRCLVFSGYTTTAGDGGQTTYDITATATVGFEPNAVDQMFRNFKLTDSGNVGSWTGWKPASGRASVDNVWVTGSGSAGTGINASIAGVYFRGRMNLSASGGLGINVSGTPAILFCIAHDTGSYGIGNTLCGAAFNIADTCGTGSASGGFGQNAQARGNLVCCTAYNQGTSGDGFRVTDSSSNTMPSPVGSIFANNAGSGISRTAMTASLPFHLEAYNDFFGNGSVRTNAEDTTGYDAAPTDITSDPSFVDAANQNFAVTGTVKNAATIALPVGGTTYLDMGALRHVDPTGGGGALVVGGGLVVAVA